MENNITDSVNLRIKDEQERHLEQVRRKIDRMVEIKQKQDALKSEFSELEAFFLQCGGEDLQNTKRKSTSYTGSSGKVTCTIAESVKVTYPSYLKRIFGDAYEDCVNVDTKYKLTAPASRMLGGLWTQNYSRMTVPEVINQLPVEASAKTLLLKKLKGANFDTDKKSLMTIGGMSESEAEEYAYFIYEAAIWESFQRLLKVNQLDGDTAVNDVIDMINGAVVVEETPKIALELFEF